MKKIALTASLLTLLAANSHAVLMTEVSSNAYITKNGYDIAWANPCAIVYDSCGPLDLSYQAQFGWQAMSSTQFTDLAISAYDFVFAGANVDYATGNNYDEATGATIQDVRYALNGDIAVAAPWFSAYNHVDWGNGVDGNWSFADLNGAWYAETLVIRQNREVPEPASIALFGLGLAGLAASRKRLAAK